MLHITKTVSLRCCPHINRRLQLTAFSYKLSSCHNKTLESHSSEVSPQFCNQRVAPIDHKLLLASSFCEFSARPPGVLPLPPGRGRTRWLSPLFVLPVRNGTSWFPPASWCKRFNVDNACLKYQNVFLMVGCHFPTFEREIHQLFL